MAQAAASQGTHAMTVEEFRSVVGTVVGVSRFHPVSQADIDAFAGVTHDFQYIHIDPARAKDGPFGGTVAHGMLSLSLISAMFFQAVPAVDGASATINYGFDKVRFLSPVPSGAEIAATFTLAGIEERERGQHLFRFTVIIQAKGATKAAVHAEWLVMHIVD